jgi:hypothetical protein
MIRRRPEFKGGLHKSRYSYVTFGILSIAHFVTDDGHQSVKSDILVFNFKILWILHKKNLTQHSDKNKNLPMNLSFEKGNIILE